MRSGMYVFCMYVCVYVCMYVYVHMFAHVEHHTHLPERAAYILNIHCCENLTAKSLQNE
jgi:hypothetical protein